VPLEPGQKCDQGQGKLHHLCAVQEEGSYARIKSQQRLLFACRDEQIPLQRYTLCDLPSKPFIQKIA
jgi:hypothetical protein